MVQQRAVYIFLFIKEGVFRLKQQTKKQENWLKILLSYAAPCREDGRLRSLRRRSA